MEWTGYGHPTEQRVKPIKKIKDPFNSEERRRNWVKPGIKNPKKTLFTPTRQSRLGLITGLLMSLARDEWTKLH